MLMSFVVCLVLFLVIGLASARVRKNNAQDYYLASHSVPPWLVGLSAVATNNSGYMFIGVIGYTYAVGLSASLLMIGWIIGDFLASLWVHQRLRAQAFNHGETSYVGVLASWAGFPGRRFRIIAAVIGLIFLLSYAGAQLVAGSKALQVLLDWPAWLGAVIGAVLVMLYCIAGGIRASIWTDAAQSLVMILAMGLMLFVAVQSLGGISASVAAMNDIPGFLSFAPASVVLPGAAGVGIFFVGWLLAGFSVIAQPHIMVRFISLNATQGFVQTRLWYYAWFVVFYCMATAVGMLSRIYLPESAQFDAELALPQMAVELLPPILVGLVLAGIFAATISTADSLLLSCSSFISQDLAPRLFVAQNSNNIIGIKIATLLATCVALGWALLNQQSVFALVVLSWAMLSAAFVPLILLLIFGKNISQTAALWLMGLGCGTVLVLHWCGIGGDLYLGLPALLVSLLAYGLISYLRRR
ncbi:sodium:proline symporter [Cellvibrio mixtus]|uniref:Sodium/proline symporter n=1 Tax=Cellvibrio mixtus TaxID=39650 RepID=A0A266Q1B1_9GAMM|nr:sodium/proline symporter [Cellvibrio mixtus]OZY83652.1 sodium:proline symporter [Cellvibrio mixtus]